MTALTSAAASFCDLPLVHAGTLVLSDDALDQQFCAFGGQVPTALACSGANGTAAIAAAATAAAASRRETEGIEVSLSALAQAATSARAVVRRIALTRVLGARDASASPIR